MDVRQPIRPTTTLWSWLPTSTHSRLRGIVAGALLASGMTALAAPPQAVSMKRAAILLPPVKLEPGDVPAIARGAIDDLPGTFIGSTPVARTGRKASSADGPAWLSGADPNLLPASGLFPSRSSGEVRTLGSTPVAPGLPARSASASSSSSNANPPFPRPSDKAKGTAAAERTPGPATPSADVKQDPNAPLRGTATNGAPLLAGPPGWRWYGYGSVTPGANVYAPAGQYPRASSDWLGVTGATPGAFPVPVFNPSRAAPGNEPPNYTVNPPSRPPITAPGMSMRGETSNVNYVPPPTNIVPQLPSIGAIGAMPSHLSLPPLPDPVGVPRLVPPPMMPLVPAVAAPAMPEPVTVVPMAVPALPTLPEADVKKLIVGLPIVATKAEALSTPTPPSELPPALTEDSRWQPTPELPQPVPPGTWMPAITPELPGAKIAKPVMIARGQMPDPARIDPAATLIQGVCRGRANGIDVRWTASKKMTVCFEVRSEPEANRLVKEISARPELAAYAIDFCVVVK